MIGSRRLLARLAILTAVYVSVAFLTGVGPVDDSAIFLRYAQNAVQGLGIVFNAGERVEGYTSPLWLACVTAVTALTAHPAELVPYVSGALGLISVLLISRRSMAGALAVAANSAHAFWSFSGMETAAAGLAMATVGLLVFSGPLTHRRALLIGLALAFGCLARPETAVLVPVFAIWIARHSARPEIAKRVMCFVFPLSLVLLHLVWRRYYYGDWLPNTAYAKAGIGITTLLRPGFEYLPGMWFWWIGVALAGATAARERLALAGWVAAVWSLSVLLVGGDFFPFSRFGVPLIPFLAAVGDESEGWIARWSGPAVVAVSLIFLAATPERQRGLEELRLARGWRESGIWLSKNLPPEATVATLVAGAVPYYSQRRTIDILGLTDAHIARQGQIAAWAHVGHQRFDSEYVLARRPDVIVLQDSGQSPWARFGIRGWPVFAGEELRYVHAMDDLVQRDLTKQLYVYRAVPLPDGTYLEALWRRR